MVRNTFRKALCFAIQWVCTVYAIILLSLLMSGTAEAGDENNNREFLTSLTYDRTILCMVFNGVVMQLLHVKL